MKKIAILYIATGKYIEFWDRFYNECEQYFLRNHEKTYFIWTDADEFTHQNNLRVHTIYQEQLHWPFPTLLRFKFFRTQKELLKDYDYIYFFNANISFLADVGEEIFPSDSQGLMVALHPGFYKRPRKDFTYEKRKDSLAYIPKNKGKHYVLGGFNGGTSKAFLKLIDDLYRAIQYDLERGVIAIWHDESHLNKYILNKNPLLIEPPYILAEGIDKISIEDARSLRESKGGGYVDYLFLTKMQAIKIMKRIKFIPTFVDIEKKTKVAYA